MANRARFADVHIRVDLTSSRNAHRDRVDKVLAGMVESAQQVLADDPVLNGTVTGSYQYGYGPYVEGEVEPPRSRRRGR